MLDLWIIRHAESLGNIDGTDGDTPLSPFGERQALALRAALDRIEFKRVFVSPLVRARQTCALALPDVEPAVDPRLRELVTRKERFLDVTALDANALRELVHMPENQPAETGAAFIARVRDWTSELPSAGRIATFTHFGVIRQLMGEFVPFGQVPQRIDHAAISRLHVTEGVARLAALNRAEHLQDLHRDS